METSVKRAELDVSVVVPTYRRPEQLQRCLDGLAVQRLRPAEIVVVRRADDDESEAVLSRPSNPPVTEVRVYEPGILAAMIAGASAARSGVIAFTDDDAVPRPDWLRVLHVRLLERGVGAAGGRDEVHTPTFVPPPPTEDVGRVTPWGRVVGNHHIGTGGARDVAVLKGVNMAFRREALAFPDGLRGSGAQPHIEVAMSLWARHQGWRLVYDPSAVVDHYPGLRFHGDDRVRPDAGPARDGAYNLVYTLAGLEPRYLWRRALFGLLVGDATTPGMARGLAGLARKEPDVVAKWLPSCRGQAHALYHLLRGRRPVMRRVAEATSQDSPWEGGPRS